MSSDSQPIVNGQERCNKVRRGTRTNTRKRSNSMHHDDEDTLRKRLRPQRTNKTVNYCENESDEECVVYTTSVSARGRVRRHRAYS